VAWERDDFGTAYRADLEIEFVNADGPEPVSSTGRAYMSKAVRAWLSGWEEARCG